MSWTLRDRAVAILFVLVLVAMVAVPAWRTFDDEPQRFGWHMFSLGRTLPEFTVVPVDGPPYGIDPVDYMAALRSDIPIADELPLHLCDVIPGASEVLLVQDGVTTTISCP